MTATLGYWQLRGMCQHVKYILEYVGENYQEKQYTPAQREEWGADKFELGLDFPNLPYYIDSEVKLTQSAAIMKYLAKKHGLMGPSGTPHYTDMIENHLMDTRMKQALMHFNTTKDTALSGFIKDAQPTSLKMVSNFLGKKDWLLDQISYVDFLLYEVLCVAVHYDANFLESFPNLKAFKNRFENLEKIKAYISSPRYIAAPFHWPLG